MRKMLVKIGCGIMLVTGFCGMVLAEHDDMHEMSAKHEKMAQKIDKELNLNADQKAQLKTFRTDQQTISQGIMKQLNEKRLAMKEELAKLESDRSVIDQLSTDIKQLTGQLIDLRTAAMLKMKEVLSAEQFKKFIRLMEEHSKKMPPPPPERE